MSLHQNRDVHRIFVNELHLRNLNSLLNVLVGRHVLLQRTNIKGSLNGCHLDGSMNDRREPVEHICK